MYQDFTAVLTRPLVNQLNAIAFVFAHAAMEEVVVVEFVYEQIRTFRTSVRAKLDTVLVGPFEVAMVNVDEGSLAGRFRIEVDPIVVGM